MTQKILVADDEQFITSAYSDGLQRAGYTVVVAHNGDEALAQAKAEHPDIILLDLIMPKINGFEVLKKLKADADLKDIPVVILTNLSQEADAAEVKKSGALELIVKSDTSLQGLVEKIKSILG